MSKILFSIDPTKQAYEIVQNCTKRKTCCDTEAPKLQQSTITGSQKNNSKTNTVVKERLSSHKLSIHNFFQDLARAGYVDFNPVDDLLPLSKETISLQII